MNKNVTFRPMTEADTGILMGFIWEMARYEHLEDQVVVTEELLREWLFEKACGGGDLCPGGWKGSGLRSVLLQLLHLPGPGRTVPGGPDRPAGVSPPRATARPFLKELAAHCRGAGLRPVGVVVSGLEPAQY